MPSTSGSSSMTSSSSAKRPSTLLTIPFSVPSEPVSRLVFLLAITTAVCVSSTAFLLFQIFFGGSVTVTPARFFLVTFLPVIITSYGVLRGRKD